MDCLLKRVYDPYSPDDGYRILTDRLWPRGLTKEKARVDRWLKDVAPSDGLRKWFAHDPDRWPEFKKRYRAELSDEAFQTLVDEVRKHPKTTLLYATKADAYTHALVLRELIKKTNLQSTRK